MKTPRSMPREAAEGLAIQALSYIAGAPERLERFLIALDMDVHIQVGPRPAGKKRAGVTVATVWSPM